jgi:tartrate-resistant acid phosphatase type 5
VNRRLFLQGLLALYPALRSVAQGTATKRYIILGDWGTGGALQRSVAAGMNAVAGEMAIAGIISVGDNIYPNGVVSADDPQWTSKFEKIYALPNLAALPWHAVLGNHDHRSDPDAQIAYGQRNPRWNMPARWYSWKDSVDGVTNVRFVGLDTQPIMQGSPYRHEQLTWLEETLMAAKEQWKVVIGHHPIRSYGHYGDQDVMLRHVKPILDRYHVQLYLCGHDHDVQIIRDPCDTFSCIVSGGGAGARATKKGANSLYAGTSGGFVVLEFTGSEISAMAYDAKGHRVTQIRL